MAVAVTADGEACEAVESAEGAEDATGGGSDVAVRFFLCDRRSASTLSAVSDEKASSLL